VDQENALFNFMSNKCSIAPICTQYGFVPPYAGLCSDSCGSPKENGNITCLPGDPGVGTPKQNISGGDLCDGSHPCENNGLTCAVAPALSALRTRRQVFNDGPRPDYQSFTTE